LRLRQLAVLLLAALLAGGFDAGLAWDTDRMSVAAQRLGPRATAGVRALQPLLVAASEMEEGARLAAINQFFNRRIVFAEDEAVWGVADYWASPLELLDKGRGDCEDFAIAKYISLRELGFSQSDMRILVLNDLNLRIPHAILIVYLNGRAFVLDNQIAQVVPTDVIRHYQPIFSINEEAWWLHQR